MILPGELEQRCLRRGHGERLVISRKAESLPTRPPVERDGRRVLVQLGAHLATVLAIEVVPAPVVEDVRECVAGVARGLDLCRVIAKREDLAHAANAVGLVLVLSYLAPGSSIAVTDTASGIASVASALVTLDTFIGTIILSDGNTVSVAVAASLRPLHQHLAAGVQLTVLGSAAT